MSAYFKVYFSSNCAISLSSCRQLFFLLLHCQETLQSLRMWLIFVLCAFFLHLLADFCWLLERQSQASNGIDFNLNLRNCSLVPDPWKTDLHGVGLSNGCFFQEEKQLTIQSFVGRINNQDVFSKWNNGRCYDLQLCTHWFTQCMMTFSAAGGQIKKKLVLLSCW